MQKLVLLIYLRDDTVNTLEDRLRVTLKEPNWPQIETHDGVALLSCNAILFDETKAHDAYVRVCSSLLSSGLPYLIVPLSSVDECLAVGKLSKEVAESLARLGVPSS